jgi:PadR family transcriptional regulator PadR
MRRMIVTQGANEAAERQAQLLRGCLDMCLLALLAAQPAHGYDLVRRLEVAGFETVSYGTVYPLITRLDRLGLIAKAIGPSPSGPPRKIYRLTDAGRDRLSAWREQWIQFSGVVNSTLTPSGDDNEHAHR